MYLCRKNAVNPKTEQAALKQTVLISFTDGNAGLIACSDRKSCRFSALVLNDNIAVSEHNGPVSCCFILHSLKLIPLDFIRKPAFPFCDKFVFRLVITLGNLVFYSTKILNRPALRSKPKNLCAVLRNRSNLPIQDEKLVKQLAAFRIITLTCHSEWIVSPHPLDVPIHFGLR